MTIHRYPQPFKYTYCIYSTESWTSEHGTTYKANEILDDGFVNNITHSDFLGDALSMYTYDELRPKLFHSPEAAEKYGRGVLIELEKGGDKAHQKCCETAEVTTAMVMIDYDENDELDNWWVEELPRFLSQNGVRFYPDTRATSKSRR
jgi:hypothetical protein